MTRHCPNPTRKLVGNQGLPEERSSDRERQEYTHTMHRATCLKFPSSENVQLPDHNQTERTTSKLDSTGTKKEQTSCWLAFLQNHFPTTHFITGKMMAVTRSYSVDTTPNSLPGRRKGESLKRFSSNSVKRSM